MYGTCTQSDNNGCYKDASIHGIIQPTMSARLRTYERFSFKYGRIEISAQMPEGDWLWPGKDPMGLKLQPSYLAEHIKSSFSLQVVPSCWMLGWKHKARVSWYLAWQIDRCMLWYHSTYGCSHMAVHKHGLFKGPKKKALCWKQPYFWMISRGIHLHASMKAKPIVGWRSWSEWKSCINITME